MDVGHALRGEGYRLTPQRRLVWDALRAGDDHLTVEQIHGRVTRVAPDLNVASVYRTLKVLLELGLVKEVRLGEARGHWELKHPDDAFHLVCRECAAVTHHDGSLVGQVREHLGEGHGFTAEAVDLVVHGVCADCRRSVAADSHPAAG